MATGPSPGGPPRRWRMPNRGVRPGIVHSMLKVFGVDDEHLDVG